MFKELTILISGFLSNKMLFVKLFCFIGQQNNDNIGRKCVDQSNDSISSVMEKCRKVTQTHLANDDQRQTNKVITANLVKITDILTSKTMVIRTCIVFFNW